MLSDPQSITISGTATSLPRTSTSPTGATYTAPDTAVKFDVTHAYGRRTKHMVRVKSDKIAVDPLITTVSRRLSASCWVAIDVPPEGYTVVEQVALVKALCDWLLASTSANTTKVVGGES